MSGHIQRMKEDRLPEQVMAWYPTRRKKIKIRTKTTEKYKENCDRKKWTT